MTHRTALVCVCLSGLLHVLLLSVAVLRVPERDAARRQAVERFSKRLPLDHRPLARRPIERATRRPLARRPSVQAAPRAAVAPAPLSMQRLPQRGMPVPMVAGPAPPPDVPMRPLLSMRPPTVGAAFRAGAVHGQRAQAEQIDLGMELLDVDALDTGRHRAVVVVDPDDRRNLNGFLYLSSIYSPSMERAELDAPHPRRGSVSAASGVPLRRQAERETLQGLADRMTERTGVRTEVLDAMSLDDPRLAGVPFLLLTALCDFSFTEAEAANLGRYLLGGGFLYAEVVRQPASVPGTERVEDIQTLRQFIRDAMQAAGLREGEDWSFHRLSLDHALFHCYYDIRTLPRGFWDVSFWYWGVQEQPTPAYLEAIQFQGEIVGLYSQKNYADFWAGRAGRIRDTDRAANFLGRFELGGEELPAYDLGINVLVCALTRPGSVAHQLVAVE